MSTVPTESQIASLLFFIICFPTYLQLMHIFSPKPTKRSRVIEAASKIISLASPDSHIPPEHLPAVIESVGNLVALLAELDLAYITHMNTTMPPPAASSSSSSS